MWYYLYVSSPPLPPFQIASKIRPSDPSSSAGPSSSGVKRSFGEYGEDAGPESKKAAVGAAAVNDPFGAQLAARKGTGNMMQPVGVMGGDSAAAAAAAAAGGMEQPTSEVIMVPDKMVGLIIGRGGEQVRREEGSGMLMAS